MCCDGGTGPGTIGQNTKNGKGASGVAPGTGSGVYGQSDMGRGGLFYGLKAQVRLQPTASASHPHSGQAGDLYVDHNHRLWFCKGGTNWKQIA